MKNVWLRWERSFKGKTGTKSYSWGIILQLNYKLFALKNKNYETESFRLNVSKNSWRLFQVYDNILHLSRKTLR